MEKEKNTLHGWISALEHTMAERALLRDLYIDYIREGGEPCTDRQFASAMRENGFISVHTRYGTAFTARGKYAERGTVAGKGYADGNIVGKECADGK